jgi:hypothetical protein
MRAHLLLPILAALPVSACGGDLDFQSGATSARATGHDATSLDVSICGGPSGLLDCNQDNRTFTVTVDGVTEPATEGFLSFGTVDATFDVDRADLGVTVTRDDGANGYVTLPDPFVLAGPTGVVHRADQIVLGWPPGGGDAMTWWSEVVCGQGNSTATSGPTSIADDGSAEIAASSLPSPGPAPCTATITFTRSRPGTMSDSFGSGSTFTGEQSSAITFVIDP